MKLRIKGNSIRLRLEQNEVTQLAGAGLVMEELCIGPEPDAPFRYALAVHDGDGTRLSHRDGELRVTIPIAWVRANASTGDTGYQDEVLGKDGAVVRILIETDLPCSHEGRDSAPSGAAAFGRTVP